MSHRASLPGPGAPIFRWSFPLRLLAAGLLVVLFSITAFGCITLYIDFVHERRRGKKALSGATRQDQSPTRR